MRLIRGACSVGGALLTVVTGEEAGQASLDVSRVRQEAAMAVLETVVWKYERVRDGQRTELDLIGAIHLADRAYYEALNLRFRAYDAVFYELVAGASTLRAITQRAPQPQASPATGINQIYAHYQSALGLALQNEHLDYRPANMIHADMTREVFEQALQEAGEDVLSSAGLVPARALAQIDQRILMRCLITGDAVRLKHEVMAALVSMNASLHSAGETSVTIHARNAVALEILEQGILQDATLHQVALFYGGSHLPDLHQRLVAAGWRRTAVEWLPAWTVPLPLGAHVVRH